MTKDKIDRIVSKVDSFILMLIVFYSAFRSTIFPQVIGTSDRVLVILIPILLACFAIHFFIADRGEKVAFLKSNVVVIAYLVVRTVSLVIGGFNSYTLGSIMYETTFLLLICRWTVGDYSNIKKAFVVFIGFNLIVNIMSFIIIICPNVFALLDIDLAIYHDDGEYMDFYPYAGLYLNPNTAGIMTAIALIVFFTIFWSRKKSKKTSYRKVLAVIYIMFTAMMVYEYDCRSAIVGLIVVVMIFAIEKLLNYDKQKLIQVVFIVIIICNVGLVGYISINNSIDIDEEDVLNTISSGRYEIWNDCYHATNYSDAWVMGHGSNEQELENRNIYLKQQWINDGLDEAWYKNTTLGVHNGFLGILFNTGIICFILFVIIMWKKIGQMRCTEGHWYLIVIFTLIVNNFESVLIMNKFYTCFLMMIVLAMADAKESNLLGGKDAS